MDAIAPYIVSKSGKSLGSRQVRFFNSFDVTDYNMFEDLVFNKITKFLDVTFQNVDKDKKQIIPADWDEAQIIAKDKKMEL